MLALSAQVVTPPEHQPTDSNWTIVRVLKWIMVAIAAPVIVGIVIAWWTSEDPIARPRLVKVELSPVEVGASTLASVTVFNEGDATAQGCVVSLVSGTTRGQTDSEPFAVPPADEVMVSIASLPYDTPGDGEVIAELHCDETHDTGTPLRGAVQITARSTVVYNFIERANAAVWTNYPRNRTLTWPGSDVEPDGFALWRHNVLLEDDVIRSRVLQTHPQWVDGGQIRGKFELGRAIQPGDRFYARVGFINGAGGRVEFRVAAVVDGNVVTLSRVRDDGKDGQLRDVHVDLANVVGATEMLLIVDADGGSGQDWAVWESARIERE